MAPSCWWTRRRGVDTAEGPLSQTKSVVEKALQPLVVAAVSSLWMAAGWNYYTAYAVHSGPT